MGRPLVATPAQVEDAVLGTRGLRAGLDGSRSPILAVMSTVPAATVVQLAEALRPLGVRVVDAPISGGVSRAEEGSLTVMTGGDAGDVEAASAVFACFSGPRFHCGALGAGESLKIINNMLGLANVVLAGEAYRLALEQRLDLGHVARVLDASSGRNAFSTDPAGPQAKYASMTRDRATFDSLLAIMRKDLGLAIDMAESNLERGAPDYPGLRGIQAIIAALGDPTYDDWLRIATAPASGSRAG